MRSRFTFFALALAVGVLGFEVAMAGDFKGAWNLFAHRTAYVLIFVVLPVSIVSLLFSGALAFRTTPQLRRVALVAVCLNLVGVGLSSLFFWASMLET